MSYALFVVKSSVRLYPVPKIRRYWRLILLALVCVVAGFAYRPLARLWAAKTFLGQLSSPPSSPKLEAPLEEELQLSSSGARVRARLYRPPTAGRHHGLVVAHGIHYQGIDEQRLVPFARALARSGLVVLTPELVDLADYRLTRDSVDRIATSVNYLAQRNDLIDSDRVGLLGFSFAGGLSLVAASESTLKDRLEYVTSVGGHHDLDRVFHFLLTNEIQTPNGVVRAKAHDYGLAVILYANLGEFLSEPELTPTRDAFRAWLHEDRPTALGIARSLNGEGARLFRLLQEQRLGELAPPLKAAVEKHRPELQSLSPRGQLNRIAAPVYLLHGSHDSVIPPNETECAHLELEGHAHDALVTPLIEHVEVSQNVGMAEKLGLVTFMAHLF